MKNYPAQFDLDKRLEAEYLNFDNGFFIEAGAADGISQSNTYYFAKERGWKGILIEPVEQEYLRCCANRTESYVYRGALVSEANKHLKTVTLSYCGIMTTVKGALGNEDLEAKHIQGGEKLLNLNSYEFSAPAFTLNSILARWARMGPAPHINLLSLDVEGYESEAIQGLDLRRHCPDYILVEHHYQAPETFERHIQNTHVLCSKVTDHNYLYKAI